MEETSVAGDPGPDAGTSTAPNAAPEPVARRQRILFVGEAATLAHVVRPFVLARSLDPSRYEVHFACDPRFNKLLGPLPFPHHPIHTVPSEEVLLKIAQGRLFYNTRTLRKYIAADRKILNEIAPDVVVGDNRLSLSVSARLAGIPYIAIANAYWSPQARRRFPLPDVPWTRFFGGQAGQHPVPPVPSVDLCPLLSPAQLAPPEARAVESGLGFVPHFHRR